MVIKMLYSYKDLRKKYLSAKAIQKMLEDNIIYKIEKGIYSDTKNVHYLELINFKYPNAIFTLESAFYYHNLTDVIPEKNILSFKRQSYQKYKDNKIKIVSSYEKYFELGKSVMEVDGININIYNKERMLIELIRNKKSIGFDYYKEIINNYRIIRENLDIEKIMDYISAFPVKKNLYDTIMKEVF